MVDAVRLSDLQDSDNEFSAAKECVNALRKRFEKVEHGDNTAKLSNKISLFQPSSLHRPLTPPARRTQGPPRPPPPKPSEKPKRHSDLLTEPADIREQTRSVTPSKGAPALLEHPLAKVKSRSVNDLKALGTEIKSEKINGSVAAVKEVHVDAPVVKKEKKGKNKVKSKDDLVEDEAVEPSSPGKKRWRLKGSKSIEVKSSPKISQDVRKASAPSLSHFSPNTSPRKEPLTPTPESPSSSEAGSSKEGTPKSIRRRTAKKQAVRKTESNQTELTSSSRGSGKRNSRDFDKKALKKCKSTNAVVSVYRNTEDEEDVMISGSHRRSLPVVEERGVKRRQRGEAEVKEEAKHLRESAVLNEGKDLTASKLEPTLRKELACLTGGLERKRHQIVMVMERSLPMINSPSGFEEFKTTLAYFRAIMTKEYVDGGATLVIDARDGKSHKPTKHLLEKLAMEDMPLPLHMVYIIIKTGFLSSLGRKQYASTEVATKLHLAQLNDTKQAVEHFGGENLVQELGGSLAYSHEIWLGNRLQYERIVHCHKKIVERLPETKRALSSFTVPSTVKDAEKLMQDELGMKEKMINLFAEAELKTDQFLTSLKEQYQHVDVAMDVPAMISSVDDMLMEIKGSQNSFDEFWKVHRSRVEHIMRMCHFSRSGEKLKQLMLGHIEDLAEDKAILGDSLEGALEQGEKHEAFATKCMETIDEQMTKIKSDAADLCNPNFLPSKSEAEMHTVMQKAIDAVRSQLLDLTRTYELLMNTCQHKRDLYIVCVKFHMNLRQLQQWNDETMELLASLPLEEPSPSAALNLLASIDQSLMRMTPNQVASLSELAGTLDTKSFKKKSDTVVKKYEHARSLLEQRKMFLQKILSAHFPHPVAPPSPQPPHQQKVPEHGGVNETDLHPPDVTPDRRSLTSTISTASSESTIAGDYQDLENDPGVLKNRQFVYKELVATEQDYIKDLSTVIDSYYDEMDPESVSIPLRLRGKREIVFGNLLEIKTFHEENFSKALEKYCDTPERIGECFTQHTVQFQMYSLYCKNRTNSETLINESTESQAFFKGIQMKLGHALHLNSYLLKPIQRITKYQLLLKDMMKHSMHAKRAHSELQVALESMLKVLKNLNDSLHVLGVKGFPGSLAEQGRLLVHDPFQVSDNMGRFSRLRERHVFLFEKVVIVSKKVEAPVQKRQKKNDTYVYKDHIQMALVNMRDPGDRHGLQFQITTHGQNKTYTFQAASKELREMWVKEIKRLLQAQFSLMKDMVVLSGTLDRSNYSGKTKLGKLSRDSRLFGDSFKVPQHGSISKRSLAGRLFNRNKRAGKRPETPKSGRKGSHLEPSASLPAGLTHSTRIHSLTPYSAESEVSEDKSDSISSDEDELAFSSDEEDGLAATAVVDHYESLAPGAPRYYTATTDYEPGTSDNGVKLTSGQEIEVIGINKYGWWWVRSSNHYTNEVEEGWVPASYLQISPDQTMPGADSLMPARLSALRKRT